MIAKKPAAGRDPVGYYRARAGNSPRLGVKRLFAAILATTFVAMTAGDLCQGWSSNAGERASCCARMANHCGSWSPDDCCEKSEQRRTRDVARTTPQPTRDMTPGALVVPVLFAIDDDASRRALADGPRTHLLLAVFLI